MSVADQRVIEIAIINNCKKLGIEYDNKYRVNTPEDNLVQRFASWDSEIIHEIGKGQGGELKTTRGAKPKFCSLYSSTSLCVNNLALFKEYKSQLKFLDVGPFETVKFEEKLPTGISSPNIDAYMESHDYIVGIESKYTETIKTILPNWTDKNGIGNLQKYLNLQKRIKYLPEHFKEEILEHYINDNRRHHLDIAQLIKHTIGLLRKANDSKKKPRLVYIYWEPTNHKDMDIYVVHREEIKSFSKKISCFIEFFPLSYLEYWQIYENNNELADCIKELRNRYQLDV